MSDALLGTSGPDMLKILCIRDPSPQGCIQLTAMHGTYHYIKQGHRLAVLARNFENIAILAAHKLREYRLQYSHIYSSHLSASSCGDSRSHTVFEPAVEANAQNPVLCRQSNGPQGGRLYSPGLQHTNSL